MRRRDALGVLVGVIAMGIAVTTANAQQVQSKKYAIPGDAIRDLGVSKAGAFATDRIMVDGNKVGYMYREGSQRPDDTGWRFFSGDESQAYIDDPRNTSIYALNTIANYDPDIIPHLNTPAPCAFEKIPGTNRYRAVKP